MKKLLLKFLWKIAKLAYKEIGRPRLYEKLDRPDAVWDDKVFQILDLLFEYDEQR